MTDICHITKVVINTVGDPRIIDQVERSNFCGGVSTNSMTQLSLATVRSARHYYDHSGTIPGAIYYKPLDIFLLSPWTMWRIRDNVFNREWDSCRP